MTDERKMNKCIFCEKKADLIIKDFKSLNSYCGDIPVCKKCDKFIISSLKRVEIK